MTYLPTDIMVTAIANSAGDWDLIPGRVMPQSQKMVPDPSLLNCIIRYGSRVK